MTKKEYLRLLKLELQALPIAEQKEALEYYENYFLDAGSENEHKVIEELGDVTELAKTILSNFACVPQKVSDKKGSKDSASSSSKVNKWLLAIIVVITFPIWINIVAALFAFIVSLLAIGFSGIIAAIAIFIAAIATIGVSIWAFAANPLVATFVLGVCFILIGIGVLAWIIGVWFFSKFVPVVYNKAKKIFSTVAQKIKSNF